jgi:hypothetical protein
MVQPLGVSLAKILLVQIRNSAGDPEQVQEIVAIWLSWFLFAVVIRDFLLIA